MQRLNVVWGPISRPRIVGFRRNRTGDSYGSAARMRSSGSFSASNSPLVDQYCSTSRMGSSGAPLPRTTVTHTTSITSTLRTGPLLTDTTSRTQNCSSTSAPLQGFTVSRYRKNVERHKVLYFNDLRYDTPWNRGLLRAQPPTRTAFMAAFARVTIRGRVLTIGYYRPRRPGSDPRSAGLRLSLTDALALGPAIRPPVSRGRFRAVLRLSSCQYRSDLGYTSHCAVLFVNANIQHVRVSWS